MQCNPDDNIGTLVVGDPPVNLVVNTQTSSSRYQVSCAGASTGNDIAIRYSLAETAGLLIQWNETGDHVFSIFQDPGQGAQCDTDQLSCYYPAGATGGEVAFSPRGAGTYDLIIKALTPSAEGTLNLSISAYKNRQVEICNNGIDDDNNGLVDCADPACFGVGTCGAPLCEPEIDVGNFSVGSTVSLNVDTTKGETLYGTHCSQGTGKEQVIRLNITQEMALGIFCTDTGSNVLQLAAQVNPLDACDATPIDCADPTVLPFGCNFEMPNIQPGEYNLIVAAFRAGQEGVMSLQLFGVAETVLEICNNGIDDDGDGKIDCADLKCVTSPLCLNMQCRADTDLGTVPLTGANVGTTVSTTGAGVHYPAACATTPGGQDTDVDFELSAKADVTLEWAQVGMTRSTFNLYTNESTLSACDAGTEVQCVPAGTTATGAATFTGLAAGKYHLIINADAPGKEGGVVLQLTGAPSP
jgi:hypothetical protein